AAGVVLIWGAPALAQQSAQTPPPSPAKALKDSASKVLDLLRGRTSSEPQPAIKTRARPARKTIRKRYRRAAPRTTRVHAVRRPTRVHAAPQPTIRYQILQTRVVKRPPERHVLFNGGLLALPAPERLGEPVTLDVPGIGHLDVPETEYPSIFALLSSGDPRARERAHQRLLELRGENVGR
ncbi:MAG TPA: hypothetical protein VHG27_05685, partial [Xanthobacteraceae bacterium]|nr:hypothetical protein [Xanthobacteraceae bacterium]